MSRRGGQGNKGGRRRSGAGRGGKNKGTGKSKGGASTGRRGGQGNRGRTSTSRNPSSNKGKRGGTSKGASTGRRGGQGNKNTRTGRARTTVSRQSVAKGLSRVGNITRQLRQPVTGLSRLAISSVLNNPAVASSIAQYGVNTFGAQNQRTRDMSKLTPQQRRKFERLSEKTGRDYSIRKPTFRLNMNMRDIARFAGLDKSGLYNRLPSSIRNAQVNKQFYGNPTKKGWHSSQRTGRGQGIPRSIPRIDGRPMPRDFQLPAPVRGVPGGRTPARMGPERDWLSDFYKQYNIGGRGGKLDEEARNYWFNEAKTKGRDNVMRTIFNTAKAEGTLGGAFGNPEWGMIKDTWTDSRGRKNYSFENTNKKIVQKGGLRRPSYGSRPTKWRGWGGLGAALASGAKNFHTGHSRAKRAEQRHRQQAAARQKSYDLQAKGHKRRQGMIAKTIAATMAARGM